MEWYLIPWKKYAVFTGRARRKEYWTFHLINFVIWYSVPHIIYYIDTNCIVSAYVTGFIFILVTFLPTLAVTVRRLHDTNRSAWNLLWGLLPIIGWIVLLVYLCQDSDPEKNKYGPNPKDWVY